MQPVTYQVRSSVVRKARLFYPGLGAVFVGLAAYEFSTLLLQAGYGPVGEVLLPPGYEFWWHAVSGAILILASAACARGGVRVFRHGSADENLLLLDADGLTYLWWGHRLQWSWRELSDFQITKSRLFGHRFIKFALADPVERKSRLGPRGNGSMSVGALRTGFHDNYDAPLEAIAARLNEYRDRALGAESGSGKPPH